MKYVRLEDPEWTYIMGVLADRPWKESNMILLKIGSQLRAATNGGVNALEGIGVGADTRAVPPREPTEIAPPNSSDSAEQRPPRSSKR